VQTGFYTARTKLARLLDALGRDLFPALLRTQLIFTDRKRLILSGLENEDCDEARPQFAETWVLHTASADAQGGPRLALLAASRALKG
jgi:hypothetical protein